MGISLKTKVHWLSAFYPKQKNWTSVTPSTSWIIQSKKQKIFHSHWFMKAQFTDTTTIRSSKSRLSPVLSRNAFLSMMESVA